MIHPVLADVAGLRILPSTKAPTARVDEHTPSIGAL
jgi:hypothetical protein